MTVAADLYALQETDSALDTCDREIARVRERFGDSDAVTGARAAAADQSARRRTAEHRARELDDQMNDLQAKLLPVERKLYGGSVRQPKELEALQLDLDMHRRHGRTIEDHQLEVMEELEASAAALTAARAELQTVETAWQREQDELRAREAELERQRIALETQRQARAARVAPHNLSLYERLRRSKAGRAVARIERGSCLGCRIVLPTTTQQRARSGLQVVQCTSCERILYAG